MEEAQRSSLVPKALLVPEICLFPLFLKTHDLLPGVMSQGLTAFTVGSFS